jgi:hypothetical protein
MVDFRQGGSVWGVKLTIHLHLYHIPVRLIGSQNKFSSLLTPFETRGTKVILPCKRAALILGLYVLLKFSLPATIYKYQIFVLNTHEQTNLLDKCDLTKITSTSHKTNERMSSSWVVREVAV